MQKKSHEALLKVLNNIGIIGASIAAALDIIVSVILFVGIDIKEDMKSAIIFAVVNALIGVLINVLLRYQGQKYAEVENKELCDAFYDKRIKTEKRHISMGTWQALQIVKDFIMKGCTTTFTIAGSIYIVIEGSHNPVQLLITLATLVMFACFGLISMNSAYCRFYNIQVPYMKLKIQEKGEQQNGNS